MKRFLLFFVLVFTITIAHAQPPAPITGSSFVCIGSTTLLSDVTTGGTWTSSSISTAVVGATTGVVTGLALGTATITYTVGSDFVTTNITVKSYPSLSPATLSGCENGSYSIVASPSGGGWASSNTAVASVNFLGVVSGITAGTANIIYTAAGGCSSIVPVTINPVPSPISGTNYVYQTFTTSLSDITPAGTWSSGNPALASVVPGTGVVTGIASGLLFISYTLPTGCAATYRVEVNPLPATTNLYAWYPFCGDSTDHSTNGRDLINHGITTTPATLTVDRFMNPNNAYHFNGVNSMMNYTTFFPNTGTPPDFTYSCWVKPTGNQSSIIMYNGNPNINGFGFVLNNGTMGTAGDQAGVYFGGSSTLYASQTLLPINAWHNLVLVKNGGVYHFYIDNGPGVFFIETTTPLFSDVFALGLNYRSTLPGFLPVRDAYDGDIDDVAVINRQLSGAERLSLFNFNPDSKLFTLGNDTTICTDKIGLAPMPQTLGGLYQWKKWNGLSYVLTDTVDTVNIVYPAVGPFGNSYSLTISKPFGCTTADTIIVYKAPIPVNLGPDQNVCIGDTINLTNFFPSASFLWTTGDTSHSIRVTTSGAYGLTVDSIFVYGPGLTDTAVCVGRDTVNITFHAVPLVHLPTTATNCTGTPVEIGTDTGYTYFWNTGQTTDTITASLSGTYWVRVNNGGCIRTDTTQVLIVYDTVTFHMHDTAICLGDFYAPWATLNPIVTYQWTPTAGIAISNAAVATITPDSSAEYYLTVSYPGCPDLVDSFYLNVQPNPVVFIGGNRDICFGDTIHINASVNPAWYKDYIYSWTPATGLDYSTTSTVVYSGLTAATDTTTFKLILTVTTPAWRTGVPGCISKDSGTIYVHPRHFDTAIPPFSLCPGDTVQLLAGLNQHGIDMGVVISQYKWTPGLYLDDSMSATPWVRPITSQNYRLIVYSQYGCTDTQHVNITVHPAAEVHLGDSVILFPGESYHINPQTNCSYFTWYPPLGLDYQYISNPTASPEQNTTYYVHATTEFGCVANDSFRVHVDPTSLIWLPNAFSPGANINSRFSVIKRGLVSLNYFRIYNRWGTLVYESKNIDEGWDGKYKAVPQPYGVYVYELEAQTNTGKVFKREGNVTLIR